MSDTRTVTLTLTEFLLARFTEEEVALERVIAVTKGSVLAEGLDRGPRSVAAHRRIVEIHGYGVDPCDAHDGFTMETIPCDTLRALASVYADHPDFRDEWRG